MVMHSHMAILTRFQQTRGDELARKLQHINFTVWSERHRVIVQRAAELVYHTSPVPKRKLPSFTDLDAAHSEALKLQSASVAEAEFKRLPDIGELKATLTNDQGRRTDMVRLSVLMMITTKALAMGLATVPITDEEQAEQQRISQKGTGIPFARDRTLAQNCHQEARQLLELL
jgi:hypothetical protein